MNLKIRKLGIKKEKKKLVILISSKFCLQNLIHEILKTHCQLRVWFSYFEKTSSEITLTFGGLENIKIWNIENLEFWKIKIQETK
jgi:hypothetical protein